LRSVVGRREDSNEVFGSHFRDSLPANDDRQNVFNHSCELHTDGR
jgi:hypothetical protein